MTTAQVLLLIGGILLVQALIWSIIFRWIRFKTKLIIRAMEGRLRREDRRVVIRPQPSLYRGSYAQFGNIKGNGVICLTEDSLIFEKLTGQEITINRADIVDATVENSFRGKPSFASGGRHLVVHTGVGNRIAFLMKNAEFWAATLKS